MISGTESGWRPVAVGVPQESVAFNLFIKAHESREHTLIKFADTKLVEEADTPQNCTAIQRDLNKMES